MPGVFGAFSWGDADFFLLDDRYHRSPDDARETPDKTLLGPRQLAWLLDALTSSHATFKVVVGGGQFLNQYTFFETYAWYPRERERLLAAIGERRIGGVLFLSGDRHHSELLRLPRPEAYPSTTSPPRR